MIASRLDVPVVPVRIEGLDKVLHHTWRMARPGRVRVAFGEPMRLTGDDYEALAKQVERRGPGVSESRAGFESVLTRDVAQCLFDKERIASSLSKDDLIDMQGTVVAVHSGGLYRVQCDAGHEVLAQLSGRMRRFRIKVVPGDRVTVGVSPYDPVRGIITFRAR